MKTSNQNQKGFQVEQGQIEQRMIEVARGAIQSRDRRRILYPELATVEYPDFDPCRASQPVAIVHMPAIVNCVERTFVHMIEDGDRI